MDIAKIKEGKHFNYTTSRGTTGRGKVVAITEKPGRGAWVKLHDKTAKKDVTLRPAQLSA